MRIGLVNRESTNRGFTLLELIVVVAVLGILVAIAIQQFAIFRSRAVDAAMRSDLKNAAIAMESYYGEFLEYPATVNSAIDFYLERGDAKWNAAELHIRQ